MIKRIFIKLLFPFFFFTLSIAHSQSYTVQVKQFQVEDGLLHRSVHTVIEDKAGFIWIGTNKGLQRFNGHNFKSWTKANKTGKIDEVTLLLIDLEGWLWIWNNNIQEFVFLHTITEEILSQEERFGKDFPFIRNYENGGFKNGIGLDSKGRIVGLSSNIGKVKNQLIIYERGKEFSSVPVHGIDAKYYEVALIDNKDHIWVKEFGNSSNLHEVNLAGKILNTYEFDDKSELRHFLEVDEKINFEVLTQTHIQDVELTQDGKQHILGKRKKTNNLIYYINDKYWSQQNFGWEVYDKKRENLLFTLYKNDYQKSLFDFINEYYEDSRGRVWITSKLGLSRIKAKPSKFKKYFSFKNEQDKPINNSARGIYVEEDSIYVNFEFGGLVNIDKQNPDKWTILDLPTFDDYYGRPIVKMKDGAILTGHQFSVKRFEIGKGTTDLLSFPRAKGFTPSAIWSFHLDAQEGLWIGTDKMLVYKDPNALTADYPASKGEILQMQGGKYHIYHIQATNNNKLWLSGTGYVYLYDKASKTYIERYGPKETGKYHLPANNFYHFYIDTKGIYWLATDQGLLRWDYQKNEKRLFTSADGLINEVIYAIFEDNHQYLWLSSDYGIMRFNKETFQVRSYLSKDGISHQEFNRTSAFQEKDGTIYFGGMNGITAFHPDDFFGKEVSKKPFKLCVSNFDFFDGKKGKVLNKTGELRQTNKIIFRPNDRFFRLGFAVPVLDDNQILFAWKIEGLDEEWNYQKENFIQIAQLPYGKQILRIKAQDNDGKWMEDQLAIDINVLRPFYLQTWFILTGLLLSLLALYLIYKQRTRQFIIQQQILEREINKATTKIQADKALIQQQSAELKQLDKTKSRFFANISHELRTPLTLILGPISSVLKSGELNMRNFTTLKKAQQSGTQLLKLVGTILDLSKMENAKMELNEEAQAIFPLLRHLISAFESHAQRSGIEFIFEYKADKNLQLKIDREKLTVIINNLLSNAIKFTPAKGKVKLQVEDLAHSILFSVVDTGRGIHPDDLPRVFDRFYQTNQANTPAEGGTGIGLALSQEFAKIMKGKLWVESSLESGSSFFLKIPRVEVLGVANNEESIEQSSLNLDEQLEDQSMLVNDIEAIKPLSEKTILVVEDNYSLRDYLQSILAPHYQIITAENGKIALELLEEKVDTIQLVLSDIMMPVMDGYQLLEELKSNSAYLHLPVVMLTARADVQDKLKALRIGVDDYLLKPFEEDELLARIDNLIKHQTQRNLIAEVQNEEEHTVPTKPFINQTDQLWLETLERHVLTHMNDSRFGIQFLSDLMKISRRQLQRKIIKLLGMPPKEYVREIKLHEVRRRIENGTITSVKEAAYFSGYSSSNYFSQQFKKRFGKSPSDYMP